MKLIVKQFSAFFFSAFLLAGCGLEKNARPVEISFWSFPNFASESGVQGDFEKSLAAAFEKEHPNVRVNFRLLDFSKGPDEIEKAVSEKNPPDVIYDAPGRIISWADRNLLVPLDDVLASEKPYITTGLLSVSAGHDRRTYMYPMHQGPFSMAFNKEMLEDYGLIDLLPYRRLDRQWTLEEYERLLRALRSKLPSSSTPGVFFYKNQGGDQGTRAFLMNLHGNVRLLNQDYSEYTFKTAAAQKNLRWTLDAMKSGLLLDGRNLTSNDAISYFVESRAAHTILYSPQLNKMYDGKRSYRGRDFTPIYMPFPNSSSTPVLEFLAGGACIFDGGDSERIEAAKSFLRFMATDREWSYALVKATGGFPVTSKITLKFDDDELLYNSVLQRFYGQYYNNITGFSQMRGYWNSLLVSAASGTDISAALGEFVSKSNSSLTR